MQLDLFDVLSSAQMSANEYRHSRQPAQAERLCRDVAQLVQKLQNWENLDRLLSTTVSPVHGQQKDEVEFNAQDRSMNHFQPEINTSQQEFQPEGATDYIDCSSSSSDFDTPISSPNECVQEGLSQPDDTMDNLSNCFASMDIQKAAERSKHSPRTPGMYETDLVETQCAQILCIIITKAPEIQNIACIVKSQNLPVCVKVLLDILVVLQSVLL